MTQRPSSDRANLADQAMKALRQSVIGGYRDLAWIEIDADLDPLRSRDDFKALIAEIKAKGGVVQETRGNGREALTPFRTQPPVAVPPVVRLMHLWHLMREFASCRILYPQGRQQVRPDLRPVDIADTTAADETVWRWADRANEDRMARPQPTGRAGRSLWRDGGVPARTYRCGNGASRNRDPGSPHPACRGWSHTNQAVTSWEHRPWCYVPLCDHEQSRIKHGSWPAVIHSATDIGRNSASTTTRPAPHRGQTRVRSTLVSWPGWVTGLGSGGAVSSCGAATLPSSPRHRPIFS